MDSPSAIAGQILERVQQKCAPYAVFAGRSVEWMPVDGKRFANLQRDPERMALFVGVFDADAALSDIEEAIQAVVGAQCS